MPDKESSDKKVNPWYAIASTNIGANLYNLPGGAISHGIGGIFLYTNPSNVSGWNISVFGNVPGQALGQGLVCIGDITGDGVNELAAASSIPLTVNGSPSSFTIFDMTTQSPIRGHGLNTSAAGLGDVNQDGYDDYALSNEGRAVSGFDGSTLYTFPSAQHLRSVADLDGDGAKEFYADYVLRNGSDGSALPVPQQPGAFPSLNSPDLHVVASSAGDFDGDGFEDCYVLRASQTNFELAVLSLYGAREIGAASGSNSNLTLKWNSAGLEDPATGTIKVQGATPGGLGRIGASLAKSDFDFLGMDLFIDPNPGNLIGFADFGYDMLGNFATPAFIRSPFTAGVSFYLQAFEITPGIAASNALELRIAP